MRKELTATLTDVGVAVGPGLPVETLVRSATAWMTSVNISLRAVERREGRRRTKVRDALVRAGRDPGAHASLDDMLAELCAIADGKVVR